MGRVPDGGRCAKQIRVRVIDARNRCFGGPRAFRVQKRKRSPTGVTVLVAHSTTHDNAAGHHHAGSPVRLPGGQRACGVSHVADYDRVGRNASNRSDAVARSLRNVTHCSIEAGGGAGRGRARQTGPMMTSTRPSHGPLTRWWLAFVKHRLNPLTLRMARAGRGPFSLVGGGTALRRGRSYRIVAVEEMCAERGRRAFARRHGSSSPCCAGASSGSCPSTPSTASRMARADVPREARLSAP